MTFAVILLFFALVPFSTSGIVKGILPSPGLNVFSSAGLSVLLLLWTANNWRKTHFDRFSLSIFGYVFAPNIIAISMAAGCMIAIGTPSYRIYFESQIVGRLINLFIFLVISMLGWSFVSSLNERKKLLLLRILVLSCIAHALIGIWQFISYQFDTFYPQLNPRNRFYNVNRTFVSIFKYRVTGFANEPSYLAPFMIDGIILGVATVKKLSNYFLFILFPLLSTLILSFSIGGIADLLLTITFIVTLFLLFARKQNLKKVIKPLSLLALVTFLLTWNFGSTIFGAHSSRFDSLFDLTSHKRLYMSVMPFDWFTEDGLLPAIFGHGPGSYKYLSLVKTFPNGEHLHSTSNNILADTIYETGVFGLLGILALFAMIIGSGAKQMARSKFGLVAAALAFHLMLSSLYRADFMSPRFWVLIFCCLILLTQEKFVKSKDKIDK